MHGGVTTKVRTDRGLTAADVRANLGEIQGGLLREYDTTACAYVFYQVTDAARGRDWLQSLAGQVTSAAAAAAFTEAGAPTQTLNIAVSAHGLAALGVTDSSLASFPHAFCAGMAARAKKLGDVGAGDPSRWEGGLGTPEIHAMVVVTANSPADVDVRRQEITTAAQGFGVSERHVVTAEVVFDQRSGCPSAHFGFVDPVSNPAVAGFDDGAPGDGARTADGWRAIAPGEFLLGYENELGETTAAPAPHDLGVNGTFIAFRKATQDVAGFRDYLGQGAATLWGQDNHDNRERLAAKIVGRWRSGCPLALSPEQDDHDIADDPRRVNDFDYSDDPDGMKCPLGAHTRRTNPRATKLTTTTDVNRKRLLRRGLEFGPPLPEGAPDDGVPRGQAGVFVVADLELQFEFIQSEWVQKGDFMGLPSDEKDPLVGANGAGGQFTVPGADMPFLFDIKQFVTVRGGEYFFAPSLSALKGLASGRYSGGKHD